MRLFARLLIFALFIESSYAGTTKSYSLKFITSCAIAPKSLAYVSAATKLKNSKTEKFINLTCDQKALRCRGSELYLSDEPLGPLALRPIDFSPQKMSTSQSIATIIYNNVTYRIDTSAKTVSINIDFSDREKPSEEIWEGKCE